MDRVERIIELERQAEKPVVINSRVRWELARLYWEEIEAGKSKAELAREIGKSTMHVLFMYRCWDITVAQTKMEYNDYGGLPPFNSIYNSPEVRGQSAESVAPAIGERRQRKPETVYDLIEKFDGIAEALATYPDELAMSGIKTLRHAIRRVERRIAEQSHAA